MTKAGPTQGAERHNEVVNRWKSHPHLASLLRAAILVAPLASAILFSWFAGRAFPADRIGVNRWLWLAMVFVLSNLLIALLRFGTDRLMPLVALMKLTLVFPDNAPSRTKAALRNSSSRTLLRRMEEARARGDKTGEALHGDYLVQLLKEVNDHDRLTRGHSERVRAYAELLGEELKLSEDDMHLLRWSALLHDVGKLSVPAEILNKDGRPTEDEWKVLSGHPAVGGGMLEPLRPWLGDWIHSADQHHCRWDGNGYPEKLAGTEIAFSGRLVAIADAFDVMTSARSYKKPLSPEVARLELTDCAGSQFDPAMVRAFLRIGLGRLRTVAGPLAWLANLTGSGQVRVPGISSVTNAAWSAGTASVGLAVAAIGGLVPFDNDAPDTLAFAEPIVIVAGDVDSAGEAGKPIEIVLSASGGEGQISFSLADPVHGTVVPASETADAGSVAETVTVTATYSPDEGYFGEDRFSFEVCDSSHRCDVGNVTITLTRANRPPMAVNDVVTIGAGEAVLIDVLFNDADPDNDPLHLTNVRTPSHGTAALRSGAVLYEPDNDYTGTDRIHYSVADPDGATAIGIVEVEIRSTANEPATTTTTIAPRTRGIDSTETTTPTVENRSPIAIDDAIEIDEDTSILVDVLANDLDVDNDPLTLAGIGEPLHGIATIEAGQIRYTPNNDYAGGDQLSYTATDGINPAVAASLIITVVPVNDPPMASAPNSTIGEDAPIGGLVFAVRASDPDNDPLSYLIAAGDPTNRFMMHSSGVVTLAAPLDYETTPTYLLQVVVSDGQLTRTVLATVNVTNVNDAPIALDDGGTGFVTAEDTLFTTANVTGNDSDVDDPVDSTSVAVVTSTSNGTLTNNGDGTFGYDPNNNYIGTDTFTYTITDGALTSNTAAVTLTVNSSTGLVISEYSNVGDSLLTNDFIELYNASSLAIDIEGWVLEVANDTAITQSITLTGSKTLIPPGGHYLLATGSGQDQSLSSSLTDSFAARVRNGALVVDTVGTKARIWSGAVPAALWAEGAGLPPLVDAPPYTPSWERKSAGGFGNCVDTDDNAADFTRNFTSSQVNPQSSASPATPCGTPVAPPPPSHLVISEYRTDGPTGGSDEFLEVFNPTSIPRSLNGVLLQTTFGATTFVFPNVTLAPGQHYLIGGPGYAGPVDGTGLGFGNGDGAQLFDTNTSSVIDDIGIGIAAPRLPKLEGRIDQSYERRFSGCQDSAAAMSWLQDFIHQSTTTPSRSTDPATPC